METSTAEPFPFLSRSSITGRALSNCYLTGNGIISALPGRNLAPPGGNPSTAQGHQWNESNRPDIFTTYEIRALFLNSGGESLNYRNLEAMERE
ncbi:hypothetical protein J6590_002223 [Homalodisca vitripennis]|nr:hypothetical protein J6590_002223 [Homalodisca vitripennis]